MNDVTDAKPIFLWAKEHGDPRIIERILVRVLPLMIERDVKLTVEQIESARTLPLPVDLANMISAVAKELIEKDHLGEDCRV